MRLPSEKLRIIVSGMVGQYPLGGVAWDYFHYLLGLVALGHEVYYHEDTWSWPLDPFKGYAVEDPTGSVRFIADFFEQHAPQLSDNWHYVHLHDHSFGMSRQQFDEIARSADLFLNVSGACFIPESFNPRGRTVFLDTDPGYNQIVMHTQPTWSQHVQRWVQQVREHDVHLTYAENVHAEDCLIPHVGLQWRTTRPVVTLSQWAEIRDQPLPPDAPFTTVMSWSYFGGDLIHNGVKYDAKAPEYERFCTLPRCTDVPLALAVGGHHQPSDRIRADGWRLIDGRRVSQTPETYRQFIAQSAGEWSIAKNVYVATRSGWFSTRTACYLAAGRPAVVQDTGWSRYLPSGEGLMAFETMEQAVAALQEVRANYSQHRQAAYAVAREYLAADRVLPAMIEAIFSERGTGALPMQ